MNFTVEDVIRARACGVVIEHDLTIEECAEVIDRQTRALRAERDGAVEIAAKLVIQTEAMRANRNKWKGDFFIVLGVLTVVLMIVGAHGLGMI